MTAIEIINYLSELIQDGKIKEDQEITIDVEAACYKYHIVEISGISFDDKKETGLDDHMVSFHIDSSNWETR